MNNKEINVLNIGLSHTLGGTEAFVKNLYEVLSQDSVKFHFLNTELNGMMYEDYYKSNGLNVYDVGYKYKDIRHFLKNHKNFDYILVHMNCVSKLYYLRFLKNKRTKIIAISHVAMVDLPKTFKGYVKRLIYSLRRLSYKILLTKKMAVSIEAGKYVFGKHSKFSIIENFIDTKKYSFDLQARDVIRKKYNISENTIIIGHVGRMAQVKNHSLLLDIFEKFHSINKNSFLVMVGDGALLNDIIKKINDLGLNECSTIIPGENNPEKYYSAFDLFVFPSLHESFGRVVLEAQCAGLPCFISNTIPNNVVKSDLVHFFDIYSSVNEIVNNIINVKPSIVGERIKYCYEVDSNQVVISKNYLFD